MELRVASSERRRHLANGIVIAKAFKHVQTERRPFKLQSDVTQKLGHISKNCSVQKLDIVP